jgi:hypothetical protein
MPHDHAQLLSPDLLPRWSNLAQGGSDILLYRNTSPAFRKLRKAKGRTVPKTKKPQPKVTIDRRKPAKDRREKPDRRQNDVPVAVERRHLERRVKVARRRQIDPTTCERDYTHEEVEFMHALETYKRTSGRMFPTCSEVLEVLKGLGYQKVGINTIPSCCGTQNDDSLPNLS